MTGASWNGTNLHVHLEVKDLSNECDNDSSPSHSIVSNGCMVLLLYFQFMTEFFALTAKVSKAFVIAEASPKISCTYAIPPIHKYSQYTML